MYSGCQVFSYDHTVSHPARRGRNIKFFKTGLGIGKHLETLNNLIKTNNHKSSTIDYLKVRLKKKEKKGGLVFWANFRG